MKRLFPVGIFFVVMTALSVLFFQSRLTPEPESDAIAAEEPPIINTQNLQNLACEQMSEDDRKLIDEWNAVIDNPEDRLASLREFKDKYGLYLHLTERSGSPSFPVEGPCGTTYYSRAKTLKENGDEVLELDSKGEIIQRWRIPFEGTVVGAQGPALFVGTTFDKYCSSCDAGTECPHTAYDLKVLPDGEFDIAKTNRDITQDTPINNVECPGNFSKKTDFQLCVEVKDELTEKPRTFVVQLPCT